MFSIFLLALSVATVIALTAPVALTFAAFLFLLSAAVVAAAGWLGLKLGMRGAS